MTFGPELLDWHKLVGEIKIEWEKKFDLDVWYVENRNFIMDLKNHIKNSFGGDK